LLEEDERDAVRGTLSCWRRMRGMMRAALGLACRRRMRAMMRSVALGLAVEIVSEEHRQCCDVLESEKKSK
jgi:hypothetical protein